MRMTTKMREAFGYDEFGNCPKLLCKADREVINHGVWGRAGGTVLCTVCGCTYNIHPAVQGALWLTRSCDAGLVKL